MSDIHNKVKKLLMMTTENGASEEEMATAMRLAAGLMMRHNITQAELGVTPEQAKRGDRISAKFEKWQVVLSNAAGHLYGCRVVFYDNGKGGLLFAGRPENIDAAQATMFYLLTQVETLYKKNLTSGLTQRARGEYRKTFKFACAARVEARALAMLEEMQTNDYLAQQATGSKALVVRGQMLVLQEEADQLLTGVPLKPLKQKAGSGTLDGQRAGDQVKLRQELGHERRQLNG